MSVKTEANKMSLELKNLYDDFRDADTIKAFAKIIKEDALKLPHAINIMERCAADIRTLL